VIGGLTHNLLGVSTTPEWMICACRDMGPSRRPVARIRRSVWPGYAIRMACSPIRAPRGCTGCASPLRRPVQRCVRGGDGRLASARQTRRSGRVDAAADPHRLPDSALHPRRATPADNSTSGSAGASGPTAGLDPGTGRRAPRGWQAHLTGHPPRPTADRHGPGQRPRRSRPRRDSRRQAAWSMAAMPVTPVLCQISRSSSRERVDEVALQGVVRVVRSVALSRRFLISWLLGLVPSRRC
jgi:hypothetical protein